MLPYRDEYITEWDEKVSKFLGQKHKTSTIQPFTHTTKGHTRRVGPMGRNKNLHSAEYNFPTTLVSLPHATILRSRHNHTALHPP